MFHLIDILIYWLYQFISHFLPLIKVFQPFNIVVVAIAGDKKMKFISCFLIKNHQIYAMQKYFWGKTIFNLLVKFFFLILSTLFFIKRCETGIAESYPVNLFIDFYTRSSKICSNNQLWCWYCFYNTTVDRFFITFFRYRKP